MAVVALRRGVRIDHGNTLVPIEVGWNSKGLKPAPGSRGGKLQKAQGAVASNNKILESKTSKVPKSRTQVYEVFHHRH